MTAKTKKEYLIYKLSDEMKSSTRIDAELFKKLDVKRGLRNEDGTGVLVGLTNIGNVVGYDRDADGKLVPIDGKLFFRGYEVKDMDTLPEMLESIEYDRFTADKYAGDARTSGNIMAAEAAIRNYCGWHVSAQPALFSLFPEKNPCGIELTDSCLMLPMKSVSGVIGIGPDVRYLPYTCGICDKKDCYKRRTK